MLYDIAKYSGVDYLYFLANLLVVAVCLSAAATLIVLPKVVSLLEVFRHRCVRLSAISFLLAMSALHSQLGYHVIAQKPLINAGRGSVSILSIAIVVWIGVSLATHFLSLAHHLFRSNRDR
jgi:hypothetical protein